MYGHLANEHTQQAAKKLTFAVVQQEQARQDLPSGVDLSKISAADFLKILQQAQSKVGADGKSQLAKTSPV